MEMAEPVPAHSLAHAEHIKMLSSYELLYQFN